MTKASAPRVILLLLLLMIWGCGAQTEIRIITPLPQNSLSLSSMTRNMSLTLNASYEEEISPESFSKIYFGLNNRVELNFGTTRKISLEIIFHNPKQHEFILQKIITIRRPGQKKAQVIKINLYQGDADFKTWRLNCPKIKGALVEVEAAFLDPNSEPFLDSQDLLTKGADVRKNIFNTGRVIYKLD